MYRYITIQKKDVEGTVRVSEWMGDPGFIKGQAKTEE